MAQVWMIATALIAVTSCSDKRNYDQGSSCTNGVCAATAASSDQTITTSEIEKQPPTAGNNPAADNMTDNFAGSAMRERITGLLDLNQVDETGSTLLHWAAARKKNTEMLKFLLAQNVIDINKQNSTGDTALHFAAYSGDYGGVQLLLNQPNIDKSLTNKSNHTAYELAVIRQRTLIAALLAPELNQE